MDHALPCPSCGQNYVEWMRLGDFHRAVLICGECDLLWLSPAEVGTELCTDLSTFLRAFRIDPSTPMSYDQLGLLPKRVVTDEGKALCPFCNQAWISRLYLYALEREVLVCLECSKLWLQPRDVGMNVWTNFREFQRAFGRDPDDPNEWEEREPLQQLEVDRGERS